MDNLKLIEILRGTVDSNLRQQAEDELTTMEKIIGFSPALLQIVMMGDVDMTVRQAGVIYLKNMVTQYWPDAEYNDGEKIPFHIHEQDRSLIRESIVDAVVHAPDLVRVQLAVCTYQMVKHDFPGRWTTIVDKISIYLQNSDMSLWSGSLLCLYQLVKFYEYKKKEERDPLVEAMKVLLPMLYDRIVILMPDSSDASLLLQKLILKNIYSLTQFQLPMDLLPREAFTRWMEVLRSVCDRAVPEQSLCVDEEERTELPCWKVKKWAIHILARLFERYGCPSAAGKEYKSFATWYIRTFTKGVFQVILKILDLYRKKEYVSPRVLQQCFNYLDQGVGQAVAWKLLKPHSLSIIQDVLFPIMCYTKADEELWNSDPSEYVRLRYDIYEDLVSPVTAAQSLLLSIVRKRKEMLEKTMVFLVQILSSPNVEAMHKDGVFHMIGSMGALLLSKKMYKDQMEKMVVQYVFPEFQSPFGFIKARCCWLLQHLEDMKFSDDAHLQIATTNIQECLLGDHDLPVKVEAAMALSAFLSAREKVEKLLEPNMRGIVYELLKVIKETENEDLTNVMSKLVTTYSEQLTPIAAEMCSQLATTFQQVVESEDGADEKAITAMGLLSTIEMLINCMEENKEIMASIEPVALQVVGLILTKCTLEYYEEALSLIYSLTCARVSGELWQCYEMLYRAFKTDAGEYFTEMMPALHNFVTVDTDAFLSTEARPTALLDMCKMVLSSTENLVTGTSDLGIAMSLTAAEEDAQCHAAKMLEVLVLQCGPERVAPLLSGILQLALERLIREVKTTELRTMLLQVVIAALYTAPDAVLTVLNATSLPNTETSLATHFVKQWLNDTDCFLGLHDRKVCVLGMCTLLQLGPERIPLLQECHKEMLPSMVLLFQGLKRAYAAKAAEENEEFDDEEEEDEDEDFENDLLESDEDEIQNVPVAYNDDGDPIVSDIYLPNSTEDGDDDEDEEESDDDYELEDDADETALESFTTPIDKDAADIDEYCVFKTTMQGIESAMPLWYEALTASLTDEQRKAMQEVATLADQRKAAAQSKKIEESGGYNFSMQTTVPSSFNFGGAFGS